MLSVGGRFQAGAPPWRRPRPRSRLASPPASSSSGGGGNSDSEKARPLLVERYRDGVAKRYMLDSDSKLQVQWEKHDEFSMNTVEDEKANSSIPRAISDFVLPAGFPESVSDDYLQYMLLQFPTNVTGWICHTMVTSSLLKAVGVGSFTGTSAAAAAAAIRWVSKDGIGAFGRLLIGGRFGTLFDDDPKKWRMYADFIGSAGSIFDLTTPLYPGYFLPLASLGNLAKAVGRGFRDPSNRVIQNHFAKSGNLGEIAAKEEVWEVGAQLVGLSIGVLVLDTPGIQSSYLTLTLTWLGVRLLHLWFRYQSLVVLKFRTVNLKRARILVRSHVAHHTVPGYVACNEEENILTWERFLQPRISFGVPMERMLGVEESTHMDMLTGEVSTGEMQLAGLSSMTPYPMATTKRIDARDAPIQGHVSLGVSIRLRLPPVQGHDRHPGGRHGKNRDSRGTPPGWPGHVRGCRWLGWRCRHRSRARRCFCGLKITFSYWTSQACMCLE